MKKTLALLLSILLLMACVPLGTVSASAATSGTTGDCTWRLEDDYLIITAPSYGVGNMGDYITDTAPWAGLDFRFVTIGAGVEWTGMGHFVDCTTLVGVTIEEGMESIPSHAFVGSYTLDWISIPASVIAIGDHAFAYCSNLTTVYYGGTTLDRAAMSIDYENDALLNATWYYGAYEELDGLQYEMADGEVTIIGYTADLSANVVIPSTIEGYPVTAIGDEAFRNCTALISVSIPDSVTAIGAYAFAGCSSLETVDIPDGITVIREHLFYDCTSLVSVTIPDSVTDILWLAFAGCTSMTFITIPKSVTNFGGAVFTRSALTDVYYGGTEADRENIGITVPENDVLLNATWHYTDIAITYGDLNGDGGINNRDLVLMQRYLNGWDVTLDLAAADVCADGSINNRDLALLQRYINEWDVTLGPEPTIVLPEVGYDLDGRGRVVISAVELKDNKVSFTFTNTSTRWMTEETCYIKYICTDAEGNELTLNDTYYGYIYFGMLEAGWSKTLTITLPEGTAKVEFGDYRIIYWTQWV